MVHALPCKACLDLKPKMQSFQCNYYSNNVQYTQTMIKAPCSCFDKKSTKISLQFYWTRRHGDTNTQRQTLTRQTGSIAYSVVGDVTRIQRQKWTTRDVQQEDGDWKDDKTGTDDADERIWGWRRRRTHEVGAVRSGQSASCHDRVAGPLYERLDVVDMVDLCSFVTTPLTNVHLDVVEALDRCADDSVTQTPLIDYGNIIN